MPLNYIDAIRHWIETNNCKEIVQEAINIQVSACQLKINHTTTQASRLTQQTINHNLTGLKHENEQNLAMVSLSEDPDGRDHSYQLTIFSSLNKGAGKKDVKSKSNGS